jgi:hypothetical protein
MGYTACCLNSLGDRMRQDDTKRIDFVKPTDVKRSVYEARTEFCCKK